jgi:cysteine desulfurase/selenocysteine lyase
MRDNFPQLKSSNLIYFDSAATTLKPQSVIDAITHFYSNEYGTVHRGVYSLCHRATQLYNNVRQKASQFINARSDSEIVFTKGTTEGINLVANSFINEGDTILVTEIEHHSNIVPWQLAAQRKKAHLKIVKVLDSGEVDLEDLEDKLKSRPKLFSLAHISNTLGVMHPIEEICKLCHAYGTCVLVDGAQSIAHIPIDVQKLDCDFFCFSAHKMYGPTGIGVLYGKEHLLEQMPPFLGGGDMIEQVTNEQTTFAKPPLKFEAGTPPIAQAIGLGAAIDFLKTYPSPNLVSYAEPKLKEMGLEILGSPKARHNLISFCHPQMHSLDIALFLDLKHIAVRSGHLCSQPALKRFGKEHVLRISFGLYNTQQEVDQLINELDLIFKKQFIAK